MNTAKKIVSLDQHTLEKDVDYMNRLEKELVDEYISLAGNSISHSDTTQLKSFIDSLEKEEFPTDSFLDVLLFKTKNLLDIIGYTGEVIQSQSSRKLKKQKVNLDKKLLDTNKSIRTIDNVVSTMGSHIARENISLSSMSDYLQEKTVELNDLESSLNDYKEVNKLSLNPKKLSMIEKGERKHSLLIQELSGLQTNYYTSQNIVVEYESLRDKDLSMKYLLQSDKMAIDSSIKKTILSLERLKNGNSLKTLASNREGITSIYRHENVGLDNENASISLYNNATKHIASYAELSRSINEKRTSLPSINR